MFSRRSRGVQTAGLGNENDLVGRFFMDHGAYDSGEIRFSGDHELSPLYELNRRLDGRKIRADLVLTEETQRREELLNYSAYLKPVTTVPEGLASARLIFRSLRSADIPDGFGDHIGNVLKDFDYVVDGAYRKISGSERGIFEPRRHVAYLVRNRPESAPNPDSRVTLAAERDALGLNRARLDFRLTDLEQRTILRAQEILASEFGRAGLGRMKITFDDSDQGWPSAIEWGSHHMGTTRMADDPRRGVVDADWTV